MGTGVFGVTFGTASGGDATAIATATGSGGAITANATAAGGPGAPGSFFSGPDGTAAATATATSNDGNVATATALALPLSGTSGTPSNSAGSTAVSNLTDGAGITSATSTASATSRHGTYTLATAQFTNGVSLANPGAQYAAFSQSVALPSMAFASALTGGTTNSSAMVAGSNWLDGAGVIGGNFTGQSGTPETYTATSQFVTPANSFGGGDLLLSLIGVLDSLSSGFGSVSLEVSWSDGTTSYDQTYTYADAASADAFFTDNVIDLGIVGNAGLTVNLAFSLTASDYGAYAFDYVLGAQAGAATDVPEPASMLLLLSGATGLSLLRRRRARA